MFTKRSILVIITAFAIIGHGCGGSGSSISPAGGTDGDGASSPTSPAQIPTSVEYAEPTTLEYGGGAVTGDISVQMGKTLEFVLKDASGNPISNVAKIGKTTDDSAVTVTLIDGATDETVTDGTCGEASVSGSTITYTAPNDWKGVASTCKISAAYNGQALAGQFEMKISTSTDVAGEALSFASSKIFSNAAEPNIAADDNGTIYLCYRSLDGSWGQYFTKSLDAGATWSTPVALVTGNKEGKCSNAVSHDGTKVAVAWTYDGAGTRGDEDTEKIVYSSDGGASFSSPVAYLLNSADTLKQHIVIDSSGTAHIVSTVGADIYGTACTTTCATSSKLINGTAPSDTEPRLIISDDDALYMVWDDTRNGVANTDVFIAQLAFDGTSSYSVGTNYQLTNSVSIGEDVVYTNATIDRFGIPVATWTSYQATTAPYSSNIYLADWNPTSGERSSPGQVNDIDPYTLPWVSNPFISYDNFVHDLYISYGANFDNAVSHYTMKDADGNFTASIELEITGFSDLLRTTTNLITDLVGRPYIIWDDVTYTEAGLLTASDTYLGVGEISN